MGSKERNKGARGERLLRDFLRAAGLDEVKRGFTYLHQSDLVGLLGIHIECKFVEKLNVRKAMDQAVAEAEKRKDGMPTVFWKASRKPWLVIMRADDWLKVYKLSRMATLQGVKIDERQENVCDVQNMVTDDPETETGTGG